DNRGAPGATKSFSMSTTMIAVFFGSIVSHRYGMVFSQGWFGKPARPARTSHCNTGRLRVIVLNRHFLPQAPTSPAARLGARHERIRCQTRPWSRRAAQPALGARQDVHF